MQSRGSHVIWLGMSCHETENNISGLAKKEKKPRRRERAFMCSRRSFALIGVIRQICSRYLCLPLFLPPAVNDRPDQPSSIKPSTHKFAFVMTEWKPAFHCVIHNRRHKKVMEKKRDRDRERALVQCARVCLSAEINHGTAHAGIKLKRLKNKLIGWWNIQKYSLQSW